LAFCSVRLSSSPLSSEEADFRTPHPLRGSFFVALTEARFVELPCAPAACRGPATDRGSAARLLAGRLALPALDLPDTAPVVVPGRVHSLGRFESDELHSALADALPAGLRDSLRAGFEWYACRGAFFHNDAHYGTVLFGAWCVAGPPREIVFGRAGTRTAAGPGDWVVFDPFEPHAVLDPAADRYTRERYADTPASLFIGFELQLDERVMSTFGIRPALPDAPVLASSVAINAETGALR
jgi:hypothetical protein